MGRFKFNSSSIRQYTLFSRNSLYRYSRGNLALFDHSFRYTFRSHRTISEAVILGAKSQTVTSIRHFIIGYSNIKSYNSKISRECNR